LHDDGRFERLTMPAKKLRAEQPFERLYSVTPVRTDHPLRNE
jgi:hypothetical protein